MSRGTSILLPPATLAATIAFAAAVIQLGKRAHFARVRVRMHMRGGKRWLRLWHVRERVRAIFTVRDDAITVMDHDRAQGLLQSRSGKCKSKQY